jgi:hypothetical protein
MVLLVFAALGCALGYRLHTTPAGYAALAVMAVLFPAIQIALVVFVRDRSMLTLLPLVIGVIMVLSTLAGAGAHACFARR